MRQRRLMNDINVVPYIDVMLVLLVIFMVTAPLITTSAIDLPSVAKATHPPAQPIEVLIRADASYALRDRARGGEEQRLSKAEIADYLQAAQAREPKPPVLIAADKSVRYELVMNMMDELQKRQIARIGLLVQSR